MDKNFFTRKNKNMPPVLSSPRDETCAVVPSQVMLPPVEYPDNPDTHFSDSESGSVNVPAHSAKQAKHREKNRDKQRARKQKKHTQTSSLESSKKVMASRGLPESVEPLSPPLIPMRQSQVWVRSNPAWTPVPMSNIIGVGLWVLASVAVVNALLVTGQVPDVASPLMYALAGYTDTPVMSLLLSQLPAVQYVAVVPVLLVTSAMLGAAPVLWLLAGLLGLQVVAGLPLFPNMGQVWPFSVGPMWAYALSLPCGVALASWGLTRKRHPSRLLGKRSRRYRPAFQLPMASSGGQVIRMKRESRKAGRTPNLAVRLCQWFLRACRISGAICVRLYRVTLFILRPPRSQHLTLWRWAVHVMLVSVLSVAVIHGLGALGLAAWLVWQHIPFQAWEDWMTWSTNMALYDGLLSLALLLWVRPLRSAFRWLVY